MPVWIGRGRVLADSSRPRVMGILNITPDSFSDGGKSFQLEAAMELASILVQEGADILDVGGESSRPGADPVDVAEELRRVIPVVRALANRYQIPISVDTTKAEVARQALEAGASIVNDIRGLSDEAMTQTVVNSDAGLVLMHMSGDPKTMQASPSYTDVVAEVYESLANKIDHAVSSGIAKNRLCVDPGIGFGKSIEHNLELLRNLEKFQSLGCAIMIGTSRKRFLGHITGKTVTDRGMASVISALAAASAGASVVRVHDVGMTVEAFQVWQAHRSW